MGESRLLWDILKVLSVPAPRHSTATATNVPSPQTLKSCHAARLGAETGLAAVQLTSDLTVHKLSLDDITEWAGPADEEHDD